MRVLVLVMVLGLSGCVATPSLEELEQQAMQTGDWSAVEQRERMMERRKARRGPKCGDGLIGYCQSSFGRERCTCVAGTTLRDAFQGVY